MPDEHLGKVSDKLFPEHPLAQFRNFINLLIEQ